MTCAILDDPISDPAPKVKRVNFRFLSGGGIRVVVLTFDVGSKHFQRKGVSICHASDVFDEAEGQRVALAHALEGQPDRVKAAVFKVWLRYAKRNRKSEPISEA